ncbi:MAG: hypothetical protein JWQ10_1467 [Herbaspirillum sp.]|jgi:PBP1b-binding outer membrane lipoprotein LpoB|nr:hypothetical protein [Herbaspirillum sp.]
MKTTILISAALAAIVLNGCVATPPSAQAAYVAPAGAVSVEPGYEWHRGGR